MSRRYSTRAEIDAALTRARDQQAKGEAEAATLSAEDKELAVREARLDVRVSQAELNRTIESSVFNTPSGAATAEPMSLDELRRAFRGEGGN